MGLPRLGDGPVDIPGLCGLFALDIARYLADAV